MKPSDEKLKRASELSVEDLSKHPVWKYSHDDREGDLAVRPISRLPVSSLTGRIVGTKVRLSNGSEVWALLGNIDSKNPRLNQHFLTLSIEREGRWFHLARYHDHDFRERGPEQLARFLGLAVDEIFPITYDIRSLTLGDPDALTGAVTEEPSERLTQAQLIALAVP